MTNLALFALSQDEALRKLPVADRIRVLREAAQLLPAGLAEEVDATAAALKQAEDQQLSLFTRIKEESL